jgi:hypothetical protein
MAFEWNPYSLPELEHLPKEERKRIWKTAWKKSRGRWQLVLAAMIVGGAPWFGNWLLQQYHVRVLFRMLWLFFCMAGAHIIHMNWAISVLRPRIWEQLPGLCPACGYNLRATPDRCPECGKEFPAELHTSAK